LVSLIDDKSIKASQLVN